MLREVTAVSQRPGEPRRRWYSSARMDLFVWLDAAGQITGYQLTYDKPHKERALTWREKEGFSHTSVDDGSRPGKHPGSPLLNADGVVDASRLELLLKENSGDLDLSTRDFIVDGIRNYFKKA